MKLLKKVSFYTIATICYSINLSASVNHLKRAEEMAQDPITRIQQLERQAKALQAELTESQTTHKRDVQALQAEVEELKEISKKYKDTMLATISVFTTEMNTQRELNRRVQQYLTALTTVAQAQLTQKDN